MSARDDYPTMSRYDPGKNSEHERALDEIDRLRAGLRSVIESSTSLVKNPYTFYVVRMTPEVMDALRLLDGGRWHYSELMPSVPSHHA